MQTLFVEGDTRLHRLPPRPKLIVLCLLGVGLFLVSSPIVLGAAVLAAAALYLQSGIPIGEALRRLRPVAITILAIALFGLLFDPPMVVAVTVLRLSTLVLCAATVTATTTISAFMDEITVFAAPLEKAGLLHAADIGLAVGLVVRFVPEILGRYDAIREAHAARGLKVRMTTTLVPLVILTLRDADNIASAIDARGIRRH